MLSHRSMRLQIQHIHWINQPVSVSVFILRCVTLSQNDKQIRWTFSHQLLPKSFHKQHKIKISLCVFFFWFNHSVHRQINMKFRTKTEKKYEENLNLKNWRFNSILSKFHAMLFFLTIWKKKTNHQLFVSFKNGPCHQTNYNICNQNILTSRHNNFSRHVNLRRNFKR